MKNFKTYTKANQSGIFNKEQYIKKRTGMRCEICNEEYATELLDFHHPLDSNKLMGLDVNSWRGVKGPRKETLDEAVTFLKEKSFTSLITTGADGSIVIADGSEELVSGEKINPIDTNGAGDMFAGSFMYAYLEKMSLTSCAKFANYAASKVVETFGPRLSKDGYLEVKNNIQKY